MNTDKKIHGAFVGLGIIIALLMVGVVYVWRANERKMQELEAQREALTALDAAALDALGVYVESADTSVDVDPNTVQ